MDLGRDVKYAHSAVDGDLQMVEGLDSFRQDLIHRWITEKGDYAARPEYGAGVLSYRNKPMRIAEQRQLAKDIEEQTLLDPRTEKVISISFSVDDISGSLVRIIVNVKPVGYSSYGVNFSPFEGEA